jgi:hypothetical protein
VNGLIAEVRIDDGRTVPPGYGRAGRSSDILVAGLHDGDCERGAAGVSVTVADRQREAILDNSVRRQADIAVCDVGVSYRRRASPGCRRPP